MVRAMATAMVTLATARAGADMHLAITVAPATTVPQVMRLHRGTTVQHRTRQLGVRQHLSNSSNSSPSSKPGNSGTVDNDRSRGYSFQCADQGVHSEMYAWSQEVFLRSVILTR